MAKDILMPKMGMTMETGTVVQWFVKEGDAVEKGDIMLSVETDKAVLDVEAFEAGTVLKIIVHEGESAPVLTCIGYIGEAGEEIPSEETSGVSEKENETVIMGVSAEAEAPIIVPEISGVRATPLARAICAEKEIDIAHVIPNAEGIVTKKEVLSVRQQPVIKATPVAEKMARNSGIDLAQVPHEGTRIFKQDVEAVLQPTAHTGEVRYIELGRIQKIAGEQLSKSWQSMPMVTNCIEVDVSESLNLVQFLNNHYGKRLNTKFGLTDVMIKVLAQAMAQNPNANVYYEDGRLRCLDSINIGLAAATPRGLVVPVIRDADKKNIMEINREKNRLVATARDGRLSPADMGDASTTFSNMGAYRAEIFTPIINYPESCIFGTGTVQKKAIVVNDEIVVRPMMWVNFTYDHRVLDGEQAAKLLNAVKDVTEMPGLFIGYEGGSR